MCKVSENLTFKPSVIFSSVSVAIMITLYSVCNQTVCNRTVCISKGTVQHPIIFVMEIQMDYIYLSIYIYILGDFKPIFCHGKFFFFRFICGACQSTGNI